MEDRGDSPYIITAMTAESLVLSSRLYNVGAYRSVYLKRFGCVHFGPGDGRQHTGHDELSVLNSSCSTHIFWLKSTVYLHSNVSSIVSHISGCVNAVF